VVDPFALLLSGLRGEGAGLLAGPWLAPREKTAVVWRRHDARGALVAEVFHRAPWRGEPRFGAELRVGADRLVLRSAGNLGFLTETAALDACDDGLGRMGWTLLDRLPGDPSEAGVDPSPHETEEESELLAQAAGICSLIVRGEETVLAQRHLWRAARIWGGRFERWRAGT
jgi:hypothetical protein